MSEDLSDKAKQVPDRDGLNARYQMDFISSWSMAGDPIARSWRRPQDFFPPSRRSPASKQDLIRLIDQVLVLVEDK
jgi:hypothetical protein